MDTSTIVKSIVVSLVLAILATVIHLSIASGSITIPASEQEVGLLFLVAVAVYAGILIVAVTGGAPAPASGTASANGESEQGTVKWFNVKKGYGFITRDDGGDVFVHYRNIRGSGRRSISEGQRVEFIVVDGKKGLQAEDVH